MFKYVFRNVKEPQIRTIRDITEKFNVCQTGGASS